MAGEKFTFDNRMLDNVSTAVYVINGKGEYIYCNNAFVKLTKGTKDEILKINVFDLTKRGDVCISAGEEALRSKKITSLINDVTTPENFQYRQMVTATPLFDGEGNVEYVVVEAIRIDEFHKKYQRCMNNKIVYEDALQQKSDHAKAAKTFLCQNEKMVDLLKQVANIAKTSAVVLIEGETGAGKGVMANYIHQHSGREKGKMIEVNCAALPENLLESELYGYAKGSFTGALEKGKKGLIEEAENGTLFLDEINSMPLALQGKLLRVLETQKIKPLGANEEKHVDFRLVVATNQDLKKCVENGQFRKDLYYRLNVVPVIIPPLRKRKEDIELLTKHFLDRFCKVYGCTKELSSFAMEQLKAYAWPGNVRELKNAIERLCIISSPSAIEIKRIPAVFFSTEERDEEVDLPMLDEPFDTEEICWEDFSLSEYLKKSEKRIIAKALEEGKSTYKAAELLGVNQSTVFRKKQQYGL